MAPQLVFVLAAFAATTPSNGFEPGSWDQWRGPARDGTFAGPAWPEEVVEGGLIEVWQVENLGPSYSGPIVTADRVFTVGTRAETDEVVRALDRASGQELWTTSWSGSMEVPFFAARNGSWIRATPAYDDGALYVAGMRDVLVRLDAETGEIEWTVDFVERNGAALPAFGFVSSPLVVDEHVYVQAGGAFLQLDKETGEETWRALQSSSGMDSPFSSPVFAQLGGLEQLLVQTRTHLNGLDRADGAVLWSIEIPAFRGMNILTPQPFGEAVFTAPYGGRAQLIEPMAGENGWKAERAWSHETQGHMTSPVVHDGHAYLFTRANRFTCLDLTDGTERWTSGPTGDSYWSLARRGDRILALSDTGLLRLIVATPQAYEVLFELELVEGQTWAHLAPAGRELYVRELHSLVAFRWS
jgi:outer membrane protein assembly factor BamB